MSTELKIQEQSSNLLEGLKQLAELANKLNIPDTIKELEVLSLMLPGDSTGDSTLVVKIQEITKLYEKIVADVETQHINLNLIITGQQ
jgi:hypothetical protein